LLFESITIAAIPILLLHFCCITANDGVTHRVNLLTKGTHEKLFGRCSINFSQNIIYFRTFIALLVFPVNFVI